MYHINLLQVEEESAKYTSAFDRKIWLPVAEGFMYANPYIEWPPLDAYTTGNIRIAATMVGFTSGEMSKWGKTFQLLELVQIDE